MELMREEGFTVGKTEQFNKFAKFRVDLFGFIDALAMDNNETVGVQSMVMGDINKHLIKIAALPAAFTWLSIPTRRIELHAWAKQGARGERKLRVIRRIDVTKQLLAQYEQRNGETATTGTGREVPDP